MIEKIYFTYDISFDIVEQFINEEPPQYDLYLATNGGDGYASLYFSSMLKKSKKLRDVICVGEVNSGGSIILSSLANIKKRKAYHYVSFMIHLLRIDINMTDMSMSYLQQTLNSMKNLNDEIFHILDTNLKLTPEDKILLLNGVNLIWTPEIALEKGLIDEII